MVLTHFNEDGRPQMVDVSDKTITHRIAVATARIQMKPETLKLILSRETKKGDVLATAQVGGIMASKLTSQLIPMCHNIMITGCDIAFEVEEKNNAIKIFATAKTDGKTGIEMEALTAASVAALTIYDMCKAVDRSMKIMDVQLLEKSGGNSGVYRMEEV
jgi:cyclic pyranopterin phosphate synthase